MRRLALFGTVCLLAACGGGQQRLATSLELSPDLLNFAPLVADAQNAYVVQFDTTGKASLLQVPTSGGAPKTLLPGQGASALSVDDTYLYWSDGKTVGRSRSTVARRTSSTPDRRVTPSRGSGRPAEIACSGS